LTNVKQIDGAASLMGTDTRLNPAATAMFCFYIIEPFDSTARFLLGLITVRECGPEAFYVYTNHK
jgi:hypothetical protein